MQTCLMMVRTRPIDLFRSLLSYPRLTNWSKHKLFHCSRPAIALTLGSLALTSAAHCSSRRLLIYNHRFAHYIIFLVMSDRTQTLWRGSKLRTIRETNKFPDGPRLLGVIDHELSKELVADKPGETGNTRN
jgi:hypothetical protein